MIASWLSQAQCNEHKQLGETWDDRLTIAELYFVHLGQLISPFSSISPSSGLGIICLQDKAESQSISDYKTKARWQGAVGFQERQGCLYSLDYLTHIPHLPQPFPLSLPSEAKCGHQSSQEVSNWNTIKLLRITKFLKEIHIMKEWLKETLSK